MTNHEGHFINEKDRITFYNFKNTPQLKIISSAHFAYKVCSLSDIQDIDSLYCAG